MRYRGTLGGTLAHGDPASDMPAVLLAAEGSVTIRGQSGQREVAAADLFEDFLTTAVGEGEILTEVRLPALEGYGFGYEKFNRRKEDWAMVAVCALVKKGADGSCEDVRIGLTHMGSTPLRATAAEAGAARAAARRRAASARPPSRRRRAPSRPPTSTPRPTTSATWRACCAGGRSSRRHHEPVQFATPEAVTEALAGEGYLADRALSTSTFLASTLGAAAAARGRGGRRQDRGRPRAGRLRRARG